MTTPRPSRPDCYEPSPTCVHCPAHVGRGTIASREMLYSAFFLGFAVGALLAFVLAAIALPA